MPHKFLTEFHSGVRRKFDFGEEGSPREIVEWHRAVGSPNGLWEHSWKCPGDIGVTPKGP